MNDIDIKFIKGVGGVRAKLLASELGVHTFRDLLFTFPYRHVDRSKFYLISEFWGEMPTVQVRGHFVSFRAEGEGKRQRLVGGFTDGKSLMEVVWFSGLKFIRENYRVGVEYVLFGKPNYYRGAYSMVHPEIEIYNSANPPGGFRGIYSLTETLRKRNLTQKALQTIIYNALSNKRFEALPETLPAEIISKLNLMPLREAIVNMHFPSTPQDLQRARERMKFEELFYIEMQILRYARRRNQSIGGYVMRKVGEKFNIFYRDVLPFELTGAQKRVLREIHADLMTGRQMNRLVQGDVGCGKTMVAFMSILLAIDNGYQTALMAPTEILATQHYETLSEWCRRLNLRCALLTGSVGAKRRREIDEALRSGELHILVGTHALLEEKVVFRNLGLAVIDEQHRFGVAQRAKMWLKGKIAPHVLIMTATPIPRTLAMTVYGDLDVSVIDELPPGRKPVTTLLRFEESRFQVERLMFDQLRRGRQIYLVYPLIKQNDKLALRSLEEDLERVRDKFRDYRVCFVHGQMKPAEKDYQMKLFVEGTAQIMVATTVIEVGVNVPNATIMVIENAERFGLSQLHQLRGRVGRGSEESFCILMSKMKIAGDTRKRLNVMTETSNGFIVAEADMKMRGPGDLEGTMQSGLPFNLKVANLTTDGQIVARAREVAMKVLDSNPSLVKSGESPQQDATELQLSPESCRLIEAELQMRSASNLDWSLIS